jgi:ABC-type sugar transport system permease subunit
MGIPVGIAGSLGAALLLSSSSLSGARLPGRKRATRRTLMLAAAGVSAVFALGVLMLFAAGARVTGMTVLVGALACGILMSGVGGGRTVYRTLFYLPHVIFGVPVFILWKKLYSPHTGPINNALGPILSVFGRAVASVPAGPVHAGLWICAMLMPALAWFGFRKLWHSWRDGEMGTAALVTGAILTAMPACLAPAWSSRAAAGWCVMGATALVAAAHLTVALRSGRDFKCVADAGLGHAIILCAALMAAQFALLGIGNVLHHLPEMARSEAGLVPPEWLTQYHWAKPSLMVMGLWMAVGSNSMLLYLAGISNIPPELYEAADVDGASATQRFWNITWPQLAPITFLITIMGVIHGLQGGFEMARTMTSGGPDGATTTLSYFIYIEGFETGRLGYASAISWALFALVFSVTVFNWKFGNRYVND